MNVTQCTHNPGIGASGCILPGNRAEIYRMLRKGWMDGWVDGRMDGWVDGRMDGWMDGCMDGYLKSMQTHACKHPHM